MYESPINIIYGEMQAQIEGDVFKAIQNVGIDVNKEELIKALQYDREQYSKGYSDGYVKAIDDVVCKISDYKEKHYHNREEYPINYGLLCDMENWFLEMKGEKQ